MEVTALAFKPVIFRELPNEVLVFANEQHFPILRFGGDEYFEEIIFDVKEYINKRNYSLFLENMMKSLIGEEVSEEQLLSFLQQMNQPFDQYVFVANIQMKQSESSRWMQSFLQLKSFLKSGLICPYKQSIFILYTDNSQQQVEKMFKDWMKSYTLTADALAIGYSQVHQTKKELHLAVREAYYACIMAKIELMPICYYAELASERLLIELYRKDAQFANQYVEMYLGPLLEERDLLDTAVTFVQKQGNIKEVAATHFCHPNTIRYRMAKIRQLIAPSSNEFIFHEHLSAAVKLYLLHQIIKGTTSTLE